MKSMSGMRDNLRVGMDILPKNTKNTGVAKLVQRLYFVPGSAPTASVPFGTTHVRVRVLGAGGGNTVDNATPTSGFYVGGGGGAYASAVVKINTGSILNITVGQRGTNDANKISRVTLGSTVVAEAPGGQNSNLADNGAGGDAVNAIGDIKTSGTAPPASDNSNFYGGAAVGDAFDFNSVGVFGNGVIAGKSSSTPLKLPARFGGGGVVFYNGSSSSTPIPAGTGLVVLEFYNGDPR